MTLFEAAKACWALFASLAVMVLGHGLIGSAVGLRLSLEGYGSGAVGLVTAGFFVGILLAALLAPRLIQRVGHIRVFAAMGALASLSCLLHALWLDAVFWFALRALGGFAAVSMYIAVESWLNDRAQNAFRGRLLSIYMLIWLLSMSGGQLLLNAAEPRGPLLFLLAGAFYAAAIVPLTLATNQQPDYSRPQPVPLAELWRISPLGLVSALLIGVTHGTILGLAAVYGTMIGLSVPQVALFSAALFWGGILLQLPLGRLSDRGDRRLVMAGVALLAAAVALLALALSDRFWALLLAAGLLGGLVLPLYTFCLAAANDRMQPTQMVGASATLYLLVGVGATVGPPLAGFAMQGLGPSGYFLCLATALTLLGLYALWRRGRSPRPEEASAALPVAPTLPPPGD